VYSIRASVITAVDIDEKAIVFAKKNSDAKNVRFLQADIRTEIPTERFDHVIWDASLEYFTEAEIVALMRTIKERLGPTGILSGFSLVQKLSEHHKYAFSSKSDLERFLRPYFAYVRILETFYPERHNLYFYASETPFSFQPDWSES